MTTAQSDFDFALALLNAYVSPKDLRAWADSQELQRRQGKRVSVRQCEKVAYRHGADHQLVAALMGWWPVYGERRAYWHASDESHAPPVFVNDRTVIALEVFARAGVPAPAPAKVAYEGAPKPDRYCD